MPTYNYECSVTGEITEIEHRMSETREGEQSPFHPDGVLKRLISMPSNSYMDPVRLGRKKPDSAFQGLMNDIHKRNGARTPYNKSEL